MLSLLNKCKKFCSLAEIEVLFGKMFAQTDDHSLSLKGDPKSFSHIALRESKVDKPTFDSKFNFVNM